MKNSLSGRERGLWMSATVILLLFALLAVNSARREAQTMRSAKESLTLQSADLQGRIDDLQREFLTAADIRKMQHLGLQNPDIDLLDNLAQQGNLIPFPPTLGGKMGFYDRDSIRILNGHWVIAAFDDGHVSGQALLHYEVKAGGKVSWRVIEAIMD